MLGRAHRPKPRAVLINHADEILRVLAPKRSSLARHLRPIPGVLAHRLQHPKPVAIWRFIQDHRFVHEARNDLGDTRTLTWCTAHGCNRRIVETAVEDSQSAKQHLLGRIEYVM